MFLSICVLSRRAFCWSCRDYDISSSLTINSTAALNTHEASASTAWRLWRDWGPILRMVLVCVFEVTSGHVNEKSSICVKLRPGSRVSLTLLLCHLLPPLQFSVKPSTAGSSSRRHTLESVYVCVRSCFLTLPQTSHDIELIFLLGLDMTFALFCVSVLMLNHIVALKHTRAHKCTHSNSHVPLLCF